MDVAARHQFSFLDRTLDRMDRRLDVYDDALLQSARRVRADADNFDVAFLVYLTDDRNDFGRTNVQSDNQVLVRSLSHSAPLDASISPSACCGSPTGVREPPFQPIVNPLP